MKFRYWLQHLLLATLIGISLLLSYHLWFRETKTELKTPAITDTKTVHFKRKIFLPSRVVFHRKGTCHELAQNHVPISEIHHQLTLLSLEKTLTKETLDTNYLQKFSENNAIEFLYQQEFNLADYLSLYFQIQAPKATAFSFHRIFLDFQKKQLAFVAPNEKQVITLPVKGSFLSLSLLFSQKKNEGAPLSVGHSMFPNQYYFDAPIRLKKYTYLLETQSHTLLANDLLGSSTQEKPGKEEHMLLYENSEHETLQFNQETSMFTLNGVLSSKFANETLPFQSFHLLEKIENFSKNFQFFEVNQTEVVYRNFIDGFPILNKNKNENIHIQFQPEKKEDEPKVTLEANAKLLQIPVPKNYEETLPTTEEVIEQLKHANPKIDFAKLTDFTVGYRYEKVVNMHAATFTPSWFFRYDGQWMPLFVLLGGENE